MSIRFTQFWHLTDGQTDGQNW